MHLHCDTLHAKHVLAQSCYQQFELVSHHLGPWRLKPGAWAVSSPSAAACVLVADSVYAHKLMIHHAGKVLKRLLKPTARQPGTRWEKFMLALHDGNITGILVEAAVPFAQLVVILTVISVIFKQVVP